MLIPDAIDGSYLKRLRSSLSYAQLVPNIVNGSRPRNHHSLLIRFFNLFESSSKCFLSSILASTIPTMRSSIEPP